MRTANDFNIKEDKTIDNFIEAYIYTKLDEGHNPVIIYINIIEQENINTLELIRRLRELKFRVSKNIKGTDSVIEIRIK